MTYLSVEDALSFGIKAAEKAGAAAVEAYSVSSKAIELSVEKNSNKLSSGISSGVSFRVVSDNNIGFAYTKTLTKERLESTVKIAMQNARAKGPDPDFVSLPSPTKKPSNVLSFDKKLESVTSDELAEDFSNLIATINAEKHLHYLQGQVFLGISKERLVNSNGIDISDISGGVGGAAAALSTKGLIPNYSFAVKGGPSSASFSIDALTEETIELTKRSAAPKTLNFQKEVPIILDPEASFGLLGGLFRLLITQLRGDRIAAGSTPYSDQIGNQIATEDFTVVDNGINPSKLTSSVYDAEGIPRERTVLIENGILQTFLLNSYYAKKLGLESNGKASRTGGFGFVGGEPIKAPPSIASTSIEVAPGDSSKDEMIAETKEGFMLRSLMGLHMSDRSSGRFAVTGFGWYIKNGEVKHPVQGIDISGTVPNLIKNIDLISKEKEEMLLADCPYIRIASVPCTSKKFDAKTLFGLRMVKLLTALKIIKHPML